MNNAVDIEAIHKSAVDISIYLNHLYRSIADLPENEQTKEIRRYLGQAMVRIYVNIMLPIHDFYPHLKTENIDYDSYPE